MTDPDEWAAALQRIALTAPRRTAMRAVTVTLLAFVEDGLVGRERLLEMIEAVMPRPLPVFVDYPTPDPDETMDTLRRPLFAMRRAGGELDPQLPIVAQG